jgi:hypothetical protein
MPDNKADAKGDALQTFRTALQQNKAADAKSAWASLDAGQKAAVKTSGDDLTRMLRLLKTDALPMMKEAGASFSTAASMGATVLLPANAPAEWMDALQAQTLWDDFTAAAPKRGGLTARQATQLKGMLDHATTLPDGRKIFEKVYPDAKDATYNATFLKTTAWQLDHLQRLYKAIHTYLPIAHAQTVSGGFYLGTDEDLDGDGTFAPLGFAWYHLKNCVVPLSSTKDAKEGGTGHDMSGGTGSGAAQAQKDNKAHITHFTGSVLHEIGHGVGDSNGAAGNNWAASATAGTPHFTTGLDSDSWSRALYKDATVKARYDADVKAGTAPPAPAVKATSPEVAARLWLADEIKAAGSGNLGGITQPQMFTFLASYALDQKLVQYYNAVLANGRANAYNFPDQTCVSGAWVYVHLTRGGHNLTKYKKSAFDTKVSWYSVSSTAEWFAEQYAHYYRSSPKGNGQPAAVQTKMQEMEKLTFDEGTGNLKAPTPGGAPAPGSSPSSNGPVPTGQGAAPQAKQDISAEIRRTPFVW